MKFRMFDRLNGKKKVAVNVDHVIDVIEHADYCSIEMRDGLSVKVKDGFDTVLARLNTIAE